MTMMSDGYFKTFLSRGSVMVKCFVVEVMFVPWIWLPVLPPQEEVMMVVVLNEL